MHNQPTNIPNTLDYAVSNCGFFMHISCTVQCTFAFVRCTYNVHLRHINCAFQALTNVTSNVHLMCTTMTFDVHFNVHYEAHFWATFLLFMHNLHPNVLNIMYIQ